MKRARRVDARALWWLVALAIAACAKEPPAQKAEPAVGVNVQALLTCAPVGFTSCTGTTTSISCAIPTGAVANDVLIAHYAGTDSTAPSAATGATSWGSALTNSNVYANSLYTAVFAKTWAAADTSTAPTFTGTASSSSKYVAIGLWRGCGLPTTSTAGSNETFGTVTSGTASSVTAGQAVANFFSEYSTQSRLWDAQGSGWTNGYSPAAQTGVNIAMSWRYNATGSVTGDARTVSDWYTGARGITVIVPSGAASSGGAGAICTVDADCVSTYACNTVTLDASNTHRWALDTDANATIGGQNGTTSGSVTWSSGAAVLSGGGSGPYISVPTDVMSGLTDVTFEAWFSLDTHVTWQRIFDFGNDTTEYIFLTDRFDDSNIPRVAYKRDNGSAISFNATTAFPLTTLTHVALSVDGGTSMTLYINGTNAGSSALGASDTLAAITFDQNYLGSSQSADPRLDGNIYDFRIYNKALSAAEVLATYRKGVDAKVCVPQYATGTACVDGAECVSGFCADGYCCDSGCANACDVCAASLGASANGTCSLASSSTPCRFQSNVCDAVDFCTGSSVTCPADTRAPVGTSCGYTSGATTIYDSGLPTNAQEYSNAGFASGSITNAGPTADWSTNVMRFTSTSNASGANFLYWRFSTTGVTFIPTQSIEYDVYLADNQVGIGGIDVVTASGSLSGTTVGPGIDQNGISSNPTSDIRPQAYGQWYHRRYPLVGLGINGKVSTNWTVADENDANSHAYTAYFDNVIVAPTAGECDGYNACKLATGMPCSTGGDCATGVCATGTVPGLLVGTIASNNDTTTANPGNLGIDPLGPSQTTIPVNSTSPYAPWPVTTTHVWTGQIYVPAGGLSFYSNFDDNDRLTINGSPVFSSTAYNDEDSGTVNPGAGWYSFEFRAGNNTGAGGPLNQPGFGYKAGTSGGVTESEYTQARNTTTTSQDLFRYTGLVCQPQYPLGTSCVAGTQCASTFCVDGRCCNSACGGVTDDCQGCSVAVGAAANGTCGVLVNGTVCRPTADVTCDLPETCNGVATTCPADTQ